MFYQDLDKLAKQAAMRRDAKGYLQPEDRAVLREFDAKRYSTSHKLGPCREMPCAKCRGAQ